MTVQIPLTRGLVALVDDEDAKWLNRWKWFANPERIGFYARRRRCVVDGKKLPTYMHRLICVAPDEMQVDHINGNKLDNRRCNLRPCSAADNQRNVQTRRDSTTKAKGISIRGGKFCARIQVNRQRIWLGRFDTIEEAKKAYAAAAVEYFGEFARYD